MWCWIGIARFPVVHLVGCEMGQRAGGNKTLFIHPERSAFRRPRHSVPAQSGEFASLVTALHIFGCLGDGAPLQGWGLLGGVPRALP